jgi:hypothetical protein
LYGTQVSALRDADVVVISDNHKLTAAEAADAKARQVPVVLTSHVRVCGDKKGWVEPRKDDLYSESLEPKVGLHHDTL